MHDGIVDEIEVLGSCVRSAITGGTDPEALNQSKMRLVYIARQVLKEEWEVTKRMESSLPTSQKTKAATANA